MSLQPIVPGRLRQRPVPPLPADPLERRTDPRRPATLGMARTALDAALKSTRLTRAWREGRTTQNQRLRLGRALIRQRRAHARLIAEDYIKGRDSLARFRDRLANEIAAAHVAAWQAIEQRRGITAADAAEIEAGIRRQFDRLDRLVSGLRDGSIPRDGRLISRALGYATSAWADAQETDRARAKRDGMTHERSLLGPADHCRGCLTAAGRGWQPIGTLVPIGQRDCKSGCRCSWEYRRGRPRRKAPAPQPAPTLNPPLKPKKGVQYPHTDYRSLGVAFRKSERAGYSNKVTVLVDVAKFDEAWRQDPGFYISFGGGGAAIEGRYEEFVRFLDKAKAQGIAVEMSEPYSGVDHETGRVYGAPGFVNGRHRFAVLRDMGIAYLPVSVGREDVPEFAARFGYRGPWPQ